MASDGAIKTIVVAIVVGLVAGGSAPWWWGKIFPAPSSNPPTPAVGSTPSNPGATDSPSSAPSSARTSRLKTATEPETEPQQQAEQITGRWNGSWDPQNIREVLILRHVSGPEFSGTSFFETPDGTVMGRGTVTGFVSVGRHVEFNLVRDGQTFHWVSDLDMDHRTLTHGDKSYTKE